MQRVTTIILVLAAVITSCRYNSYTPVEPGDTFQIYPEVDFFYSPEKADIFYLGDDVPIEYRRFSQSDIVNIYIIKKGKVIYTLAQRTQNDGSFIWKTNSTLNTSVQYQVKIENASDTDIYILSKRFGLISK